MKFFESTAVIFQIGGGIFTVLYPWRFHSQFRLALLHLPLLLIFVWIRTGGNLSPFISLIALVYLLKLLVFAFRGRTAPN